MAELHGKQRLSHNLLERARLRAPTVSTQRY
jgi:hypothetical protein